MEEVFIVMGFFLIVLKGVYCILKIKSFIFTGY